MGLSRTIGGKAQRGELDAVLVLSTYGIGASDALKLIDYPDIDYFIEEYGKRLEKKATKERIEFVDNTRLAWMSVNSKKGFASYHKWRNAQLESLKEEDKEELTLFDRLRPDRKRKKILTVFDKLRSRK